MARLDDVLEHRVWRLNQITGDNYEVEDAYNEGCKLIRNHSTGGATDVNHRRMTRPAMIDLLNALLYVQWREHEKYVRERLK